MQTLPQSLVQQLTTYNGAIPAEGPKAFSTVVDFSVYATPVLFDMVLIKNLGKVSGIQSIFIDNSNNASPVTVQSSVINLPLTIPGNYQGIFPMFVTQDVKLTVSTAGTGKVGLYFFNFPMAASVWPGLNQILSFNGANLKVSDSVLDACVIGTTLTVSDTLLDACISGNKVAVSGTLSGGNGTFTDGSGTLTLGGTSQQIFAVNASRKYLMIQNNSSGALWINETSAAVQNQPSIQLAANGGSFVMEGLVVSTGTWNINGATTGQAFTAKQI